jgi:aromatic ring-opening dioxygenase catalytic subunit (LigB family)
LPLKLQQPDYIVVCSAHWETPKISITSAANPELLYDYFGFPDDSYQLKYPCPGAPELASHIADVLSQHGMEVELNEQRGLDHGVFHTLDADVPKCRHSSSADFAMVNHSTPAYIFNSEKLSVASQPIIFYLSGRDFSFHNMSGFFSSDERMLNANTQFEDWLTNTLCSEKLTVEDREARLLQWSAAPGARLCHPREEHLLPQHVCFGIMQGRADQSIQMRVLGKRASHFIWVS